MSVIYYGFDTWAIIDCDGALHSVYSSKEEAEKELPFTLPNTSKECSN